MKKTFFIMAMMLCAIIATAKDIKTAVLTVSPQMTCENCENRITENLRYIAGIKDIKASAKKQTITIEFDADKTSPDAFVKSLEKIGYAASVQSVSIGSKAIDAQKKADKKTEKAEKEAKKQEKEAKEKEKQMKKAQKELDAKRKAEAKAQKAKAKIEKAEADRLKQEKKLEKAQKKLEKAQSKYGK